MASNYPPGVTGNEPQIVGYDDEPKQDERECSCGGPMQHAAGLWLDMNVAWHALTLAEWEGRTIDALATLYDAYLTSLGAYCKFRSEWGERQAQQEAERKQRANFAAVADGMAPPHPSEY